MTSGITQPPWTPDYTLLMARGGFGCWVPTSELHVWSPTTRLKAEERGLAETLAHEFRRESSATADALCYADMTTGPDGQNLNVHDRLAEIRTRYGPDHLVTRFIVRAEPDIVGAVARTERRLCAHEIRQPM